MGFCGFPLYSQHGVRTQSANFEQFGQKESLLAGPVSTFRLPGFEIAYGNGIVACPVAH
jgi:hypothetical protein